HPDIRQCHLQTMEEKLNYARLRRLPIEEPKGSPITIDRNLWGVSLYVNDLQDSWEEPTPDVFSITRAAEAAPLEPTILTLGFEAGLPSHLNGQAVELLPLVRNLNRLGGENGIGRSDVVEDRLFGVKSREFYEAPVPTILLAAHRDLESLVHSRELIQLHESTSRRYAELVYMGLWFHDARRALQTF